MYLIHFDKKFKKDIQKRRKTQTIQKGICVYPLRIIKAQFTDGSSCYIKVTNVYHKQFKDLTNEEIYENNFKYNQELESHLKKYYPDFRKNSRITIIRFKYKNFYKFLSKIKNKNKK